MSFVSKASICTYSMRNLQLKITHLIQAGVLASIFLASSAHANPYDGTWKVTTNCGPSLITKRPAFSIDDEIKITNGVIKFQWFNTSKDFTDTTNWSGKISGQSLNIVAQGSRTNGENWTYSFEGSANNPNKLTATGTLWSSDKRKARECRMDFTAIQLASAGPSKADIQAEREQNKAWLANEKQKLDAQKASIDSKSQEIEKKERQLREKEALLKKEKAAKDAANTKPASSPAAASTTPEKPKTAPVSSGF
jgi:hypothetical protein